MFYIPREGACHELDPGLFIASVTPEEQRKLTHELLCSALGAAANNQLAKTNVIDLTQQFEDNDQCTAIPHYLKDVVMQLLQPAAFAANITTYREQVVQAAMSGAISLDDMRTRIKAASDDCTPAGQWLTSEGYYGALDSKSVAVSLDAITEFHKIWGDDAEAVLAQAPHATHIAYRAAIESDKDSGWPRILSTEVTLHIGTLNEHGTFVSQASQPESVA